MTDKQDTRHHYWMVSGNVIVLNEDDVSLGIMQNAMVTTDTFNFGVYQIGKAQQALQQVLIQKMGEIPKIVDVIIIAITPLGHMTEAEFHWRPDDVQLQEMANQAADSIFGAVKEVREQSGVSATVIDLNAARPSDHG